MHEPSLHYILFPFFRPSLSRSIYACLDVIFCHSFVDLSLSVSCQSVGLHRMLHNAHDKQMCRSIGAHKRTHRARQRERQRGWRQLLTDITRDLLGQRSVFLHWNNSVPFWQEVVCSIYWHVNYRRSGLNSSKWWIYSLAGVLLLL